MSDLSARTVPVATIPMIDLGLVDGNASCRRDLAVALRQACEKTGFFYLSNHGVSPWLMEAAFAASRRLFDLSPERLLRVHRCNSAHNRGYEPVGTQTLEAGAPADLKESFFIGHDVEADDPRLSAGHYNVGPNLWPEDLPGFRETMTDYFLTMNGVARRVMRALALSLDLDTDFFADFCEDPVAILRLLRYPPQPPDARPNEKGCGAHRDFGAVTLLAQDSAGGLQLLGADGEWLHAPPIDGAFVVNIGDMLGRWTNDRYRSTLHRVVNLSGRERLSIPFFFDGNPDYLVRCLPGCVGAGERYAPIRVSALLAEFYRLSYEGAIGVQSSTKVPLGSRR